MTSFYRYKEKKRKYCIFGTGTPSIRLTEEEKIKFDKEKILLHLKYYKHERDRCGIYASNQDKYVRSLDEFNKWDNKSTELLYQKFKHLLVK